MTHTPSADDARARFAAASEVHLHGALTDGVTLEPTDAATWERHSQALWKDATDRTPPLDLRLLADDDEQVRGADLMAAFTPPLQHRVLLRAGDEVIGAYWGMQETMQRYYMVNSVVRRDWQGRGVYRALLGRVVAAATDAGFREIYSRHRADNNAILVPKLKFGFAIAAFEVTPRYGLLVHLRYYPSPRMRAAFQYRIDGAGVDVLRAAGVPLP